MRRLWVVLVLPCLAAGKCIDYDPRLTAPPPGTGPEQPGQCEVPEELPPSVAGMLAAACPGKRCSAERVVDYWLPTWEANDVERRLALRELAGGALAYEITDGAGAPSDLQLEAGVPVTLTVSSPNDGPLGGGHDVTAPRWFREVAWREVSTADGTYMVPHLDAVVLGNTPGVERHAVLRFVPVVAGTYDLWSSPGVTGGDAYADLADGTTSPDLGTGEAAAGMHTVATVSGDPAVSLFQDVDADRLPATDRDPRRDAGDPVWAAPAAITVEAQEGTNPATGADVFHFAWSTTALSRDVPYALTLSSLGDNVFQHNFTSPGLLRDSVLRGVADTQIELRAATLASANIEPGGQLTLFLVPTVATTYRTYCRLGVVLGPNGAPDLHTGHAGAGMLELVTVSE